MINLIENETLKVLRRRRFTVVVAILFAILAVVTYSQYQRLINQIPPHDVFISALTVYCTSSRMSVIARSNSSVPRSSSAIVISSRRSSSASPASRTPCAAGG